MILPNSKNKKYVEVVSGLYILYIILNPILNIDKGLAVSKIEDTIGQISSQELISQEDLARSYILGIENSLKEKIELLGYEVDYIQFQVTMDYSQIAKIEVKMKAGTDFDEDKIKEIALENFSIDKGNIKVF